MQKKNKSGQVIMITNDGIETIDPSDLFSILESRAIAIEAEDKAKKLVDKLTNFLNPELDNLNKITSTAKSSISVYLKKLQEILNKSQNHDIQLLCTERYNAAKKAWEDFKKKFISESKKKEFITAVQELYKLREHLTDMSLFKYLPIMYTDFKDSQCYLVAPITSSLYACFYQITEQIKNENFNAIKLELVRFTLYMTLASEYYIYPSEKLLCVEELVNITHDNHPEGMILFKDHNELNDFLESLINKTRQDLQRLIALDPDLDRSVFHQKIERLELMRDYPQILNCNNLYFIPRVINDEGEKVDFFIFRNQTAEGIFQDSRSNETTEKIFDELLIDLKDDEKIIVKLYRNLKIKSLGIKVFDCLYVPGIDGPIKISSKNIECLQQSIKPIIEKYPQILHYLSSTQDERIPNFEETSIEEEKIDISKEHLVDTEVISAPDVQKEVLALYQALHSPIGQDASILSSFYVVNSEKIIHISPEVIKTLDESIQRGRFEYAASKGFVGDRGQTGIKKLSTSGDLILTEVKVLGKMQNGKCTIGDTRLVCIWNKKDDIMYGFALQNHKEVRKTVDAFKLDPNKFYQAAMKQFKSGKKDFTSFIKQQPKKMGFSHGY